MLFISSQKLFSFLRYSNFCPDFFVTWENRLIRKLRLISKFMTWQPGEQTIAIHILCNMSRSKANQTMKFGQLKEFNVRNIFFQKSCWK